MPTILELFRSSTVDTNIETNPDTFLEQEVSGLRIKSAVELNNPLLYGNEAIRIANRSTKDVEDMRASFSETPDGGLIGGAALDPRVFTEIVKIAARDR